MEYYENLKIFFKTKGLKQIEVAEILGHNSNMIGKYFRGESDISGEFLKKLTEKFPDLDLNAIFSTEEKTLDLVEEPRNSYNSYNMVDEIEDIEKRLARLKAELARKSHGKR